MYCKVCGNLLEESDLICKVCGANIEEQRKRETDGVSPANVSPIGFPEAETPAEPETELPETAAPETDLSETDLPETDLPEIVAPETAAPEIVAPKPIPNTEAPFSEASGRGGKGGFEFQWNVHKFPSFEARKTEDIDFNWNIPVSEYARQDSEDGGNGGESAVPGAETPELPSASDPDGTPGEAEKENNGFGTDDAPAEATPAADEAGVDTDSSIFDWLYAEETPNVFGYPKDSEKGKDNRGRFFTFDKKNEEFQRLLDKEHERLETYDSPIINEARDMLALWDLPSGFAGKKTDPATMRWIPSVFRDSAERQAGRTSESPAAAQAPSGAESEAEAVTGTADEPGADTAEDAGEKQAGQPDETPGGAESGDAGEGELSAPDARDEDFDATEAELSISKTLDAIEREIEEWESRDRLSIASKIAVIISVIFLIFTGGSSAVKRLAPHSPVDAWFDSVQWQTAVTIKHGVDTIRDFFNDSEEEAQNTRGIGE